MTCDHNRYTTGKRRDDYFGYISFAEHHKRKKIKQRRCPDCQLWLYPCERREPCGCGLDTDLQA